MPLSFKNLETNLVTGFNEPVRLDTNGDVSLVDGSDTAFGSLNFNFTGNLNPSLHLDLDGSSAHVSATDGLKSNSIVSVDRLEVGQVRRSSDQWSLTIDFHEGVAKADIEKIIQAVTFTYTYRNSNDDYFVNVIGVSVATVGGKTATQSITVETKAEEMPVITTGENLLIGGDKDDFFYTSGVGVEPMDVIDGGAGNDTLILIRHDDGNPIGLEQIGTFSSIETIQGSGQGDHLGIRMDQAAGVTLFEMGGGKDVIEFRGATLDLRGKTFIDVEELRMSATNGTMIVDRTEYAQLASGRRMDGDRLIVTNGTLTDAERTTIHRRGIDTIVTLEDGKITKHKAPTIAHLNGDRISLQANGTAFLDSGRDAIIKSDDGRFTSLELSIARGSTAGDVLTIDTSGAVGATTGVTERSRITVDDVEIGFVSTSQRTSVRILFHDTATAEQIEQLLRALMIKHEGDQSSQARLIEIKLEDLGGRTSQAIVMVGDYTGQRPTGIQLDGTKKISEMAADGTFVGNLSASDASLDETFTYRLIDDAGGRFRIGGNGSSIEVADGLKLDYERATSHTIRVEVTDSENLTYTKSFTIKIGNVKAEDTRGSIIHDNIIGGVGNDTLGGGLGRDTMTGGRGKDCFVFDTAPDAKGNVDRIKDFDVRSDSIWLDNSCFKALGEVGSESQPARLLKGFFVVGTRARDADDHIIYDAKSGALYYDADGSGAEGPVLVARLAAHLKLTAADFFVI